MSGTIELNWAQRVHGSRRCAGGSLVRDDDLAVVVGTSRTVDRQAGHVTGTRVARAAAVDDGTLVVVVRDDVPCLDRCVAGDRACGAARRPLAEVDAHGHGVHVR